MRGLAFRDPAVRARLEAILHPRIEARRRDWMEARRKEGASLVVAEIPLLFEVGLDEAHDVSVVVTGPAAVRLQRLADRGVDAGEARRIMDAQMEPGRKAALADYVLENDGTLEDLEGRALALLDVLRRRAERE
jgi:dephospho-CoA kinase